MKNLINAAVMIVAALMILSGVTGCMESKENKELYNAIEQLTEDNTKISIQNAKMLLEQKYDMPFEAEKIGNRLDRDTVSLFMHPVSRPDICFMATLDNGNMTCSDNLIKRIVGKSISDPLTNELGESGIEISCSAYILSDDDSAETNTDIEIKEYFERYHADTVMLYMAISGESSQDNDEKVKSVCRELAEQFGASTVLNAFYITGEFEACAQEMSHNPELSSSWFDRFRPAAELSAAFEQN